MELEILISSAMLLLCFWSVALPGSVWSLELPASQSVTFCDRSLLNASCTSRHVLLVQDATYGRMRSGVCGAKDYEIGCRKDVRTWAHNRCSGQVSCEQVQVPDDELYQTYPCGQQLKSYLQLTYTCLPVVNLDASCSGLTALTEPSGFIAPQHVGPGACKLILQLQIGQRINFTLIDYGPSDVSSDSSSALSTIPCRQYAVIADVSSRDSTVVCSGQSYIRHVFTSDTHHVTVNLFNNGEDNRKYLLHYTAVGCPEPRVRLGIEVTVEEERATMTCNSSGKVTHLVCKHTEWVGQPPDCVAGYFVPGEKPGESMWRIEWNSSFGLMVVVCCGVVIGAVVGTLILALVVLIFRRRYTHCHARHRLVAGPPPRGIPSPGPTKACILMPSPETHDAHKYRGGTKPFQARSCNRALLRQCDAPVHGTQKSLREARQFVKSEDELLEILPKK